MWATIWQKLKEIIQRMIGGKTIENTLHVTPIISTQMEQAIQLWSDMYKGQSPWIHEPTMADPSRVVSLGLPALIASEKARTALLEMNSEITAPVEEGETKVLEGKDVRAKYLESQYKKLKRHLRKQLEYGIAKGGLVIKPYVVFNNNTEYPAEIEFDYIQADCFYPLAFDTSERITEAAFVQTKVEKNTIYRRLEYHKWENNTVQVINRAFKSMNTQNNDGINGLDLGEEIPLSSVYEWKDLPVSTTISNVERPLFAYFKMPEANIIDTSSPLGMSGFARVKDLIKDADMQYSRLLWEYEAGEMAIDIDRDALNFIENGDGTGYSKLGMMQQRLYRKVDLGEDNTFHPYSPVLRDAQYIQGLNMILMRIEDGTGLSRGTLSDSATDVARTATELKILKQRSYQTNADIQTALQRTLEDVIYVMNTYCTLYNIVPEGEYDVSFEWDDSIIVDVDTELEKRLLLMQNGITSKIETRMWYFGETERQAQEALTKIDEENMQSMEQELAKQANEANLEQGGRI